jgi:hypothetical protein
MQGGLYNMNAPPNHEIFVVLFSKFSQSCQKIANTLQFIQPHVDLRVINVDNPKTREIVMKSGYVTSLPCIVLMVPDKNKMSFFQREEAVSVLNRAVEVVQQKLAAIQSQQQQKQKSVSSLKTVLQSQPTDLDILPGDDAEETKATISGRMSTRIARGAGHESMGVSSLPQGGREGVQQLQQKRETDLGVPLDDEDLGYDEEPRGMSRDEILGPQGGAPNARDIQSKNIKDMAMEMAKQRDTMK